jgi:membrane protein YqaA with SNARE-associated domain
MTILHNKIFVQTLNVTGTKRNSSTRTTRGFAMFAVVLQPTQNSLGLIVYAGLFFVAFSAATILPLQSEALLAGLLVTGNQPVCMLILVASVGNVMGSTVNWWLGRSIERFHKVTSVIPISK